MRFITPTQIIPRDPHSTGLKVLAAGQWRCATSSLQIAFEQILSTQPRGPSLAPSMHGAYIMPSVPLLKLCCAASRELNCSKRQALLRELYTGYNASSDWPGMAFVDDLVEMYPDMKLVLNQRSSAQAWETSVRGTLRFFSTRTYFWIGYWIPQSYWHHQGYAAYQDLVLRRFGIDDVFTVELYEVHAEWVREIARARGKEVLEWSPQDGWEPLCKFLGKDVPARRFPVENDGEAIRSVTMYLVVRGLLAWVAVVMVAAGLVLLCFWIIT